MATITVGCPWALQSHIVQPTGQVTMVAIMAGMVIMVHIMVIVPLFALLTSAAAVILPLACASLAVAVSTESGVADIVRQ